MKNKNVGGLETRLWDLYIWRSH